MRDNKCKTRAVRRAFLTAGLILVIGLATGPATAAEGIDPEADKILRSMSSYLGGLSALSVNADIDNEIVSLDGQKLQLSAFSTILMQRPGKFCVKRKGMFADTAIIFDGKTLTVYGKRLNVYTQIESPGTIDDAIRTFEIETGLDAPGADLLFADPYTILADGVVSGDYLGKAYIDGVECHHLAFRKAKVDWQLWVRAGESPLPMKYIITTKWIAQAPQYAARLRDWNTKPTITSGQFIFSVPEGARKLENIPVNEMGELIISEEEK